MAEVKYAWGIPAAGGCRRSPGRLERRGNFEVRVSLEDETATLRGPREESEVKRCSKRRLSGSEVASDRDPEP